MAVIKVTPVVELSVRKLCLKPYHGHPHGCPNYGNKTTCPPVSPLFKSAFRIDKPFFAIYNIFDLQAHIEKMKENPKCANWTEYQLKCVLYWQNTARKRLKEMYIEFLKEYAKKGYIVETCPEAMGVNVTKTMANVGIFLEWPPKKFAYQIAIAGIPIKRKG